MYSDNNNQLLLFISILKSLTWYYLIGGLCSETHKSRDSKDPNNTILTKEKHLSNHPNFNVLYAYTYIYICIYMSFKFNLFIFNLKTLYI